MNSFKDEVCEYTSTPVTENFVSCPTGTSPDNTCPSGCRNDVGMFRTKGWCTPSMYI